MPQKIYLQQETILANGDIVYNMNFTFKETAIRDYTLENFDETPRSAMIKAVNAYLNYGDIHDAYQSIANDFYKNNSKEYLQTLSKYYDAQLTKLDNTYYGGTIYHLIVYNPALITVIDKIKYD